MNSTLVPLWAGRTDYGRCWRLQEALHLGRVEERVPDVLLLTEHEHTYTTGRRRGAEHLLLGPEELRLKGIAYYRTDRGGDITYHGPGQLVGYPIVRLRSAHGGVVGYLRRLELALVRLLGTLGVEAHVREGLTGVWTRRGKIASIGVRISACVTLHGFALNVDPDLSYFEGIVPCGIAGCTMTSVAEELGGHAASGPAVESLLEPAAAAVAEALELQLGQDRDGELLRLIGREIAESGCLLSCRAGPVLE